MSSKLFSWRAAELSLLGLLLAMLAGCPPGDTAQLSGAGAGPDGSTGVYYAAPNKVFEQDTRFDVRWKVTHEPVDSGFNPSINIDNRQLAIARCTRCHECGFKLAFDMKNYGSANEKDWKPVYRGADWNAPIRRMISKENSFLNEVIAERIYLFLRDETTGGYDVTKDPKGKVTIEVDEQGNPIKHERAKTSQP